MLVDSFKEEVNLNWKWSMKIEWGLARLRAVAQIVKCLLYNAETRFDLWFGKAP